MSMTDKQQVFWHHLGKELETLMTEHVEQVKERWGDDWTSHIDPWKLVIPCMQQTMQMCEHWETFTQAEREHKTKQVLDYNNHVRELLAPSLQEINEGMVLTDPETGISFTYSAMKDLADIAVKLEQAPGDNSA